MLHRCAQISLPPRTAQDPVATSRTPPPPTERLRSAVDRLRRSPAPGEPRVACPPSSDVAAPAMPARDLATATSPSSSDGVSPNPSPQDLELLHSPNNPSPLVPTRTSVNVPEVAPRADRPLTPPHPESPGTAAQPDSPTAPPPGASSTTSPRTTSSPPPPSPAPKVVVVQSPAIAARRSSSSLWAPPPRLDVGPPPPGVPLSQQRPGSKPKPWTSLARDFRRREQLVQGAAGASQPSGRGLE